MENKFNRFLSLLLAVVMVVGMMPISTVFAAENDDVPNVTVVEPEDENPEGIHAENVTEPITGTITENVTWNDGDEIGGVIINGNVTITVKGTVTVSGTIRLSPDAISSVTFNGENNAKLIRGSEFTGQMFYAEGVSGNFQNLTFNDITLDGGAVWTGDVDKTLNRGKTNEGVKATGSVLYLVYANADLNDSVLQNHDDSTGEKANAVFLRYYSTIDFNNSVVRNNNSVSSYYSGGVITVRQGGIVKTNNTEVYGNFGTQGGFFGTSSTGSFGGIVEVYNSKFHNNYAASGALFDMQCNSNKGYLLIDGCEFYENASGRGLIYEHAYSRPVTIKNSYFHGNECAVWDCHADPVLNLSGKIVIEEDPDYTKYLFETPLVLGAPLAEGSSIPLSEASLTKLGNTIITGTAGYTVTEADLAKLTLPEGYSLYLADTNGDGIGDVVSSNNTTQTAITLTLKDMVDASASEEATVYSDINCLPINPFAHEGLIFAGWIDVNGKTVAKQKFAETMTLTATWKLIAPIAKLSREGATLKVTVTNASDAVTYSYQWYMDDVAIEGATEATYTMTDVNSHTYKCVVTASKEGFESMTGSASGNSSAPAAAQVGETKYGSLKEAITAANAIEGGATVTLLKDITLGEKLTISGTVTISGAYTITRADTYTGTLFTVNSGATLTLDGGLVIDGGNDYAFDKDAYTADANDWNKSIAKDDSAKWFTPEEGAPVATAFMFTTTGGTINLNKVTIQNNYSISSGVISAGANSSITLTGAKITHVASTQGSGVVANVSGANINVTVNEGTVIDGNHVGGNHGLFKIYSGAKMTMNGGEIKNNTGWNSNGVVVGVYWGTFNMKGGLICSNTGVYGPSNGRNSAIYLHSGHNFEMTGGTICHNSGRARGGIDAPYDNGTALIKGGEVLDNISRGNGDTYDVLGTVAMKISGGTFTQDVSQWCAKGFKVEKNADGTYGVKKDPTYGKVAVIGDQFYETLAEAIAAAQNGDTITFLADITEDVTVNKAVTINGAGKTYTGKMTLEADTTIKNVNFDGKGYNGYAVETRGANYVTIEECTAKNYGFGFLQLASGTALTTVKKVTISDMNYGIKIDYSNAVVLENVDITAAVAAVLNSNYGEKTITIKNSKLNILGTWTRNNTTQTAYTFEGTNTVGEFITNAALDTFKLADVNTTLTAPAGQTVTTDVEGMKVVYENGIYKVVPNATKVIVTVDNATKVAGNPDPEFTYTTDIELGFDLDITYTVDGTTINATVAAVDGYEFEVVPGTLTTQTALVRVNSGSSKMYFVDLNEALQYAYSRSTTSVNVKILGNLTVTEPIVINDADAKKNSVEMTSSDLSKNCTITVTGSAFIKMEAGTLYVKSLNIEAENDAFYVTGGTVELRSYGSTQITNVTSKNGNCVYIRGGKVNVYGARLTSLGEYPAIQGNGNYAGNVNIGIWNYSNNKATSTISAPNADMAIYWPQNGTLSITAGTITGKTALYVKSGRVNISGGKLVATGEKADFTHNSNGANATGDAVVIEACKDAAYETPVVVISGGTFTSANAEAVMFYGCNTAADEAAVMELTGGIYSSMPAEAWCAEGMGPMHYGENQWTVEAGVISVNGVWFKSWDDAESSITKNATIVLHADVQNYYGGTVAKDFKFPTNGGTITLDLNGYTFTSAKSEASAVTSISVQYGTVLNIIGGGKIVIENNSYPFTINPKATVKMAEDVTFVGTMQWNVNGGNSGNLYVGDTALVGVDGIFQPTNTVRIVSSETGDRTLAMGDLNMTADYATLAGQNITINQSTTLNINENGILTLNAETLFTNNGTVKGEGKVVVNTIDQFKTILAADIKNIELGSAMTLADELTISEDVFVTGMANLTVTGKLTLTAGTYDMDVNKYCGDLFVAVKNEDGKTWTVTGAVAAIGNVKYPSLPEAVAAAKAGQTVKLLCDASGAGVVIDKKLTINFNSFTYTVDEPVEGASCGILVTAVKERVILTGGTLAAGTELDTLILSSATDLRVTALTTTGAKSITAVDGKVTVNAKCNLSKNADGFVITVRDTGIVNVGTIANVSSKAELRKAIEASAYIGNNFYGTLQNAVNAGGTVTVYRNITEPGIVINNDVNITFGNFTYTVTAPVDGTTTGIQIAEGVNAVLRNATIQPADGLALDSLIHNSGNLSVSYATLKASALDCALYCDNGASNMTGTVTIEAKTTAVYVAGSAKIEIAKSIVESITEDMINAAAKINTTYYGTFDNAYASAADRNNIIVLRDAEMAADLTGKSVNITINAGTTVDLAGHALTAKNIVAFGNLIDSADGVGAVVASGEYYYTNHTNNDYLPLKDGDCYRLFKTEVKTRGVKRMDEDTLKYGYTIYFDNADAYKLLCEVAADNVFSVFNTWTGDTVGFTRTFKEATLVKFAQKAYEQKSTGGTVSATMTLTVSGVSDFVAGDKIYTVPTIATLIGVTVNGATHTYTIK